MLGDQSTTAGYPFRHVKKHIICAIYNLQSVRLTTKSRAPQLFLDQNEKCVFDVIVEMIRWVQCKKVSQTVEIYEAHGSL